MALLHLIIDKKTWNFIYFASELNLVFHFTASSLVANQNATKIEAKTTINGA
jgi:hypothetical protein